MACGTRGLGRHFPTEGRGCAAQLRVGARGRAAVLYLRERIFKYHTAEGVAGVCDGCLGLQHVGEWRSSPGARCYIGVRIETLRKSVLSEFSVRLLPKPLILTACAAIRGF